MYKSLKEMRFCPTGKKRKMFTYTLLRLVLKFLIKIKNIGFFFFSCYIDDLINKWNYLKCEIIRYSYIILVYQQSLFNIIVNRNVLVDFEISSMFQTNIVPCKNFLTMKLINKRYILNYKLFIGCNIIT